MKLSPPSARRFGSGAVEAVERGGMLSVSEGRQINTTKHFGGGVNVSAGATLFKKAGALSLSHIHTRHKLRQMTTNTQKNTHQKQTAC